MVPPLIGFDTLKVAPPKDFGLRIATLKLEAFLKTFLPGQNLEGRVLSAFGPGRALVEFQGHSGVVATPRKLIPGQRLSAQVEFSGTSPVLKLTTPGTSSRPALERAALSPPEETPVSQDRVRFSNNGATQRSSPVRNDSGPQPGVLSTSRLQSLGLKPEVPVSVEVINTKENGLARVNFQGRELDIQLNVPRPIPRGEVIQAIPQVREGGFVLVEVPVAESLGNAPALNRMLKDLLPFREALGPALHEIEATLESLARTRDPVLPSRLIRPLQQTLQLFKVEEGNFPNPGQLKEIVSKLGLEYEARIWRQFGQETAQGKTPAPVSNLKGQLQEVLRFLESRGASDTGPKELPLAALLNQVRTAVQSIEHQQINLYLARYENNPWVIQIPQLLNELGQNLTLYFRREDDSRGKAGRKRDRFTLVFLLELSALGPVRADVRVRGNHLDMTLRVTSQPVLEFLRERFSELQELLEAAGYESRVQAEVQVEAAREIPEPWSGFVKKDPSQLVDILT